MHLSIVWSGPGSEGLVLSRDLNRVSSEPPNPRCEDFQAGTARAVGNVQAWPEGKE